MRAFSVLLLSLLLPLPALAGVVCSTIEDADERAYCRAVQTKSQGQCSFISDHALRQQCRVRTGGSTSNCNTITSAWEREKCRDAARAKEQ